MKTVVYDPLPCADNINPGSMPQISKSFTIGDPVVLTGEDAEIALTNPHIRLADAAPTKAAIAVAAPSKQEAQAPQTSVVTVATEKQ